MLYANYLVCVLCDGCWCESVKYLHCVTLSTRRITLHWRSVEKKNHAIHWIVIYQIYLLYFDQPLLGYNAL